MVYINLLKLFKSKFNNKIDKDIDNKEEDIFYNVEYIINSKSFKEIIKYRV